MWRFPMWRLVSYLQNLPVFDSTRVLHHPTPPKHRLAVFFFPSLVLFSPLPSPSSPPSPFFTPFSDWWEVKRRRLLSCFATCTFCLSLKSYPSLSFLFPSSPPPPLPFLLAPLRRVSSSNWLLSPFFLFLWCKFDAFVWSCGDVLRNILTAASLV